jgi:hypothetical protein
MPASKRYLGLKRRTFLFVLLALVIGLLALIIGLAAGLTAGRYVPGRVLTMRFKTDPRRRSSKFLPLPSNKQSFDGDLTYYGVSLYHVPRNMMRSDSLPPTYGETLVI